MYELAERNQVVRSLIRELGNHKGSEIQKADRVAVYAVATGEKLGLSDENLLTLRYAAQLHNLAPITVRTELDASAEPVSDLAYSDVKLFVSKIHEILEPIEWLQDVIPILCSLHEHFVSTGIRDRTSDQMPTETQIIAVCVAFDSSAHSSDTQPSASEEEALAQLRSHTGTRFVPEIVEAFASILPLIQPLSGLG